MGNSIQTWPESSIELPIGQTISPTTSSILYLSFGEKKYQWEAILRGEDISLYVIKTEEGEFVLKTILLYKINADEKIQGDEEKSIRMAQLEQDLLNGIEERFVGTLRDNAIYLSEIRRGCFSSEQGLYQDLLYKVSDSVPISKMLTDKTKTKADILALADIAALYGRLEELRLPFGYIQEHNCFQKASAIALSGILSDGLVSSPRYAANKQEISILVEQKNRSDAAFVVGLGIIEKSKRNAGIIAQVNWVTIHKLILRVLFPVDEKQADALWEEVRKAQPDEEKKNVLARISKREPVLDLGEFKEPILTMIAENSVKNPTSSDMKDLSKQLYKAGGLAEGRKINIDNKAIKMSRDIPDQAELKKPKKKCLSGSIMLRFLLFTTLVGFVLSTIFLKMWSNSDSENVNQQKLIKRFSSIVKNASGGKMTNSTSDSKNDDSPDALISSLTDFISQFQIRLQDALNSIDSLGGTLNATQLDVSEACEKFRIAFSMLEGERSKYNASVEAYKSLNNTANEYQKNIAELTAANLGLQGKNVELEKDKKRLNETANEMDKNNSKLTAANLDLQSSNNDLEKVKMNLTQLANEKDKKISELSAANLGLQDSNSGLEKTNKNLNDNLSEMDKKNIALATANLGLQDLIEKERIASNTALLAEKDKYKGLKEASLTSSGLLAFLNSHCDPKKIQESFHKMLALESINDVIVTSDGSYLIVGATFEDSGSHNIDVSIIKLASDGTFLWERTYPKTGSERIYSISATPDGGFVAAGNELPGYFISKDDLKIEKYSSMGDLEWRYAYNNSQDGAHSIVRTRDGSFVTTGAISDPLNPNSVAFWMMKLSTNGASLWQIRTEYYPWAVDDGKSVIEAKNGDLIFTGTIKDLVAVVRVSSEGTILSLGLYSIPGFMLGYGYDAKESQDGGLVVVANSYFLMEASSRSYLIKIAVNGSREWTQTYYDGFFRYEAATVEVIPTGYIVAGSRAYYSQNDVLKAGNWLVVTDLNGKIVDEMQYSGGFIRKVKYLPDGALIVIEDMAGVSSILKFYPQAYA